MVKFTKMAIINGFLEILKKKSLDKITVKDICELCEINRNTFYYYFEDIYDVLNAVFVAEKEKVMGSMDENMTFLEEYKRRAQIILNNRDTIIHIYQSKQRAILENYLETVVKDFVEKFVDKAAEGHGLTEEDVNYITCFYSYSIIGNMMRWIEKGMPPYKEDLISRMSKSFEVTINDLIRSFEE